MRPHFCFICEAFETAVLSFLHFFLNIQITNNTDDDNDDDDSNNNYNNADDDNNSNNNKYNESSYQSRHQW